MAGDQLDFGFEVPAQPRPAGPVISGKTPPRPSVPRVVPPARPVTPPPPVPIPERPQPFHYTDAMWPVVRDLVRSLEELRHIDLDRVMLSVAQARQKSTHGVYASCVPMRFEAGEQETQIGRKRYRMQTLLHQGREILYVIYFMLPRFHDEQDYREKLATIIHELYHISPLFNGDIRRFPGKNFAHGHSREVYHAAMRKLADHYLATSAVAHSHEFLQRPFSELARAPGGIIGTSIAKPRAVLVDPPPVRKRR